MALLIKSSASTRADREVVQPANGSDFKLAELQGFVGGHIELLRGDGLLMVIDEEGKRKEKPVNTLATMIAWGQFNLPSDDCIVGDVIVCLNEEVQ